jgi:sirohydrochlorin ferrochelatase
MIRAASGSVLPPWARRIAVVPRACATLRAALALAATAVVILAVLPAPGAGLQEASEAPRVGVVVVAHGGGPSWNGPVLEVAARAERLLEAPVAVSFLMGDAVPRYRFQDAVARVAAAGAEHVVVVPLLASSHGSHYTQIRWLAGDLDHLDPDLMHHLHASGTTRPDVGVPLRLTPALDASMEIATILADRALALATEPTQEALFVVGHGPNGAEHYAGWMANLRPVADSIGSRTGFRDVKLGLLRDDAPDLVRAEAVRRIREIIDLQHRLTGRDVVVVPVLVSRGYVSTRKLPRDLDGLPVRYEGEGLLPHDQVAEWIARRAREAAAR